MVSATGEEGLVEQCSAIPAVFNQGTAVMVRELIRGHPRLPAASVSAVMRP